MKDSWRPQLTIETQLYLYYLARVKQLLTKSMDCFIPWDMLILEKLAHKTVAKIFKQLKPLKDNKIIYNELYNYLIPTNQTCS